MRILCIALLASTALSAGQPTVVRQSPDQPLVEAKYLPLTLANLGAAFSDPVASESVVSLTTDSLNLESDRVLADVLKSPKNLPAGAEITAVAVHPAKVFAFITRGRGKALTIVPGPLIVTTRPGETFVSAFAVTLPSGRIYYVFGDDGSLAFPFGQGHSVPTKKK